jgi:hypothetical protein
VSTELPCRSGPAQELSRSFMTVARGATCGLNGENECEAVRTGSGLSGPTTRSFKSWSVAEHAGGERERDGACPGDNVRLPIPQTWNWLLRLNSNAPPLKLRRAMPATLRLTTSVDRDVFEESQRTSPLIQKGAVPNRNQRLFEGGCASLPAQLAHRRPSRLCIIRGGARPEARNPPNCH